MTRSHSRTLPLFFLSLPSPQSPYLKRQDEITLSYTFFRSSDQNIYDEDGNVVDMEVLAPNPVQYNHPKYNKDAV